MLKTLASLFFYTRFLWPFSALGHRRRVAARPAPPFDFHGQRWCVTGASGGIGRAIVLGALRAGAEVHALARDPAKLDELRRDAGADAHRLHVFRLDLSNLADTEAWAKRAPRFDVLVHNVGVMLHAHSRTAEGVETSFATNLLVPFAMNRGLRDAGALDASSVVISVSSGGAYGAKLDVEALESRDSAGHDGFMAYAQHKRGQIELTRALNAEPGAPRAYVMHPGWVDTDGVRTALPGFRRMLQRVLRTGEQGADTALWLAATRPEPSPEGGIWLDRHRDTEHAFAMTRGGASAGALADFLRQRASSIR